MQVIFNRLQDKIEKLLLKHEEANNLNVKLNAQLEKSQQEIENTRDMVQELKEKNKILKLSVSLSGEDTVATKKKINDLVREIDKCIALLNK